MISIEGWGHFEETDWKQYATDKVLDIVESFYNILKARDAEIAELKVFTEGEWPVIKMPSGRVYIYHHNENSIMGDASTRKDEDNFSEVVCASPAIIDNSPHWLFKEHFTEDGKVK